ncbi:MAG: response regulator transcription factor [Thermomicrobiales bacterium]|nr:response regulator transcription factor [Thermomicrobiales bacterium]
MSNTREMEGLMTETTTGVRPVTVLVVEDDPGVASLLRRGLAFEGYDVSHVSDGAQALVSIRNQPPDLLILDVMLPVMNGIDVAKRIRSAEAQSGSKSLPILMLTARDAVPDRIAGLDAGADDYLVKPFSLDELMARLRALLRRGATSADDRPHEVLTFDDIQVDLGTRIATRESRELRLTPREFDLLVYFLRNPNFVLTRAQIMQRVWGDDFWGDSNVLEVFVANLRKTLEAGGEPRVIQTVRGVGYVLRKLNA